MGSKYHEVCGSNAKSVETESMYRWSTRQHDLYQNSAAKYGIVDHSLNAREPMALKEHVCVYCDVSR
jgi:hypothetical protein